METIKNPFVYWFKGSDAKRAIWHAWEFEGWYRGVPNGTLGQERVKDLVKDLQGSYKIYSVVY